MGWRGSWGTMRGLAFVVILGTLFLLCTIIPAYASDFMMKGPPITESRAEVGEETETSSVRIALLGLIKFYQSRISSQGGPDRCGFRPSCSHYGYEAIKEQGPALGIVMIGDRQTRCNIFKKPGPDYPLLPNGKLFDPISNNLLFE
jgi:putative membrane protein insertion efficiency factor